MSLNDNNSSLNQEPMLPANYQKKLLGDGDCPLTDTFTPEQVDRRISFYKELNEKREHIPKASDIVEKKYALYGHDDTTTVRVYMRETASRIAAELFWSDFTVKVENVNKKTAAGTDKDHGYVVVTVKATMPEIRALLEYLRPGSSYYSYEGEQSKYVAGDTSKSEFIITKTDDLKQPKRFWRRSQSFIAKVKELA